MSNLMNYSISANNLAGELEKINPDACYNVLKMVEAINPNDPLTLKNLSILYMNNGKYDEAIKYICKAAEYQQNDTSVLFTKGLFMHIMNRPHEAIEALEKAVAIPARPFPELEKARSLIALQYLYIGKLKEGFQKYNEFWNVAGEKKYTTLYKLPHWKGEDLSGKHLLIYCHHGYGDTIQFSRYLKNLKKFNPAKVSIEVPRELYRLFKNNFQEVNVTSQYRPVADANLICNICYLPVVFGTDIDSVPESPNYIKSKLWKNLDKSKINIAICWAGNDQHDNDQNRSCPLNKFNKLKSDKIQFWSIQKGNMCRMHDGVGVNLAGGFDCYDLWDEITDFQDTADIIQSMDLVITVDTAIAHLAGAMGKPTWLLLANRPEWRWIYNMETSPWYYSMKIFKQKTHGNWDEVIDRVKAELGNV